MCFFSFFLGKFSIFHTKYTSQPELQFYLRGRISNLIFKKNKFSPIFTCVTTLSSDYKSKCAKNSENRHSCVVLRNTVRIKKHIVSDLVTVDFPPLQRLVGGKEGGLLHTSNPRLGAAIFFATTQTIDSFSSLMPFSYTSFTNYYIDSPNFVSSRPPFDMNYSKL